jgi:Mn-containing catalase
VERIEECFKELGVTARAKPCRGMMGIIEEGEEVIQEGKKKDDAAADLSLIVAAQRVEHYEASGYSSARNLAQQLRSPVIVQLLSASPAKEENANQLLNQVAQSLMSSAKMPAAVD